MESSMFWFGILLFNIITNWMLFALPATLSLPKGTRSGLQSLSLADAAQELKNSGLSGWELVVKACKTINQRMEFSRRNGFMGCRKAFERGYGNGQQQAYAFKTLLESLGFEAQVVRSFKVEFPDGSGGNHIWVKVKHEGEIRHYDTVFMDEATGNPTMSVYGRVYEYNPLFRIIGSWLAIGINAFKWYKTGTDNILVTDN